MKEIELYTTKDGYCPYVEWIQSLSPQFRTRINKRINRMRDGNLGDWKPLTNSELSELRFFFGKGYRVYFKEHENTIILILAGSDKDNQNRVIRQANLYYDEYKTRSKQDEYKI